MVVFPHTPLALEVSCPIHARLFFKRFSRGERTDIDTTPEEFLEFQCNNFFSSFTKTFKAVFVC